MVMLVFLFNLFLGVVLRSHNGATKESSKEFVASMRNVLPLLLFELHCIGEKKEKGIDKEKFYAKKQNKLTNCMTANYAKRFEYGTKDVRDVVVLCDCGHFHNNPFGTY